MKLSNYFCVLVSFLVFFCFSSVASILPKSDGWISRREEYGPEEIQRSQNVPVPSYMNPGPLDNIFLDWTPQPYDKVNDDGSTSRQRGFGTYTASGKPSGPVSEEQFIDHTRKLAEEVKNHWDTATPEEKNRPDQIKENRIPMAVGQLTKPNEPGSEFDFRTQGRPTNDFKPGANGREMIDESQRKQAAKTQAYQVRKFIIP